MDEALLMMFLGGPVCNCLWTWLLAVDNLDSLSGWKSLI